MGTIVDTSKVNFVNIFEHHYNFASCLSGRTVCLDVSATWEPV